MAAGSWSNPTTDRCGMGLQQRLGVAAAAERGVDDHARGHGGEQLDHQVDQHRAVRELGCGPAHRRASRPGTPAGMSPRVGLGEGLAEMGPSTAPAGSRRASGTAQGLAGRGLTA